MKISLHAYAFGPHGGWVPTYLVEEAIKRTAKLGYDGIELDAARPHVWPDDINKKHRVAIKKLVKECNLEVPAISGYYFGMNFSNLFNLSERLQLIIWLNVLNYVMI